MTLRVYEFSKKHGIPSKDLISLLRNKGFEVASHMSILPSDAIAFLELHVKQGSGALHKNTPTHQEDVLEEELDIETPADSASIILEPMTVSGFAHAINKPVSEVIIALLKQGVMSTKNQILPEKVISQLAHLYSISLIEKPVEKKVSVHHAAVDQGEKVERQPVVVVIGHVDHGKTTLLDFIRKTRVAAREKGGITQHLGAYEAKTSQGNVVFLDTPGHEAFSLIRVRGLKVADIAILVVAADDGIMPQTIEAIKAARAVGLPIIVAINKVDKASPQQIESVKRGLGQYDLIPEEWGGQTICVPISAKTGQGVSELLDIIVLQSQLMELTASIDIPARGFILESKLEKGRGPVATVICQHGILKVGDNFVCGSVRGRVSSLIDSAGQRVDSVLPSIPASVAGFSELPQVGDLFEVVTGAEIKKSHAALGQKVAPVRQVMHENALNIIIKADNVSSKEALLQSISKISGKTFKQFYVVASGVGSITESDIDLALDTKSLVYGLHVKVEPNAASLAQKMSLSIKLYDIIYKMLDDLQIVAERGRPIKKITKKIGEASILKVFDIKNLGIIAGAHVRSGRFSRDGKVVVWRGKYKVGEGAIKSLQRDKKSVKDVQAGFECAFMVDGFTDWVVDDRVECYLEVTEVE
ncbi:MAG: translation initiation factor IF-2 [Candidatus Babeliaceae bacterium]|jgi:translation initiation factor IF-2